MRFYKKKKILELKTFLKSPLSQLLAMEKTNTSIFHKMFPSTSLAHDKVKALSIISVLDTIRRSMKSLWRMLMMWSADVQPTQAMNRVTWAGLVLCIIFIPWCKILSRSSFPARTEGQPFIKNWAYPLCVELVSAYLFSCLNCSTCFFEVMR